MKKLKNKSKKKIVDQVLINTDDNKSKKGLNKYVFKCSLCGMDVTLEGDDPDFSKRTTCNSSNCIKNK